MEGQGLPRPLAAGFTGLRIHFVVGVVDVIVDVAVVGVVLQSCTSRLGEPDAMATTPRPRARGENFVQRGTPIQLGRLLGRLV